MFCFIAYASKLLTNDEARNKLWAGLKLMLS
jgi:hypothetical protein